MERKKTAPRLYTDWKADDQTGMFRTKFEKGLLGSKLKIKPNTKTKPKKKKKEKKKDFSPELNKMKFYPQAHGSMEKRNKIFKQH